MIKVKKFSVDMYGSYVYVFVGPGKDMIDYTQQLKNFTPDLKQEIKDWDFEHSTGMHMGCTIGSIIWLEKLDMKHIAYWASIAAHESFHAMCEVANTRHLKYDDQTSANEAFAYLIEFILFNILYTKGYKTYKKDKKGKYKYVKNRNT